MSPNTKVVACRLPKPLAEKLEDQIERDYRSLLLRILLEDFFAGRNFYSKNRFEIEKKAKNGNTSNRRKLIIKSTI